MTSESDPDGVWVHDYWTIQVKGVPKKVSHSDFRVFEGKNKYYQYISNF